jgi:hypothetical protein
VKTSNLTISVYGCETFGPSCITVQSLRFI